MNLHSDVGSACCFYRNDGLWDDVRIDHDRLHMAFTKQSNLYPFAPPNLENFNKPLPSKHVRLSLIGFHGRTPLKEAHALYLHTEKYLILMLNTQTDELGQSGLSGWNAISWPGIDPGLHLKIELPRIQPRFNEVAYIEAQINQDPPLRLQKIESLETISQQLFNYRQPLLYVRTLTRTAGKAWAFQAGTKSLTEDMNEGWSALTRFATGALLSQTDMLTFVQHIFSQPPPPLVKSFFPLEYTPSNFTTTRPMDASFEATHPASSNYNPINSISNKQFISIKIVFSHPITYVLSHGTGTLYCGHAHREFRRPLCARPRNASAGRSHLC